MPTGNTLVLDASVGREGGSRGVTLLKGQKLASDVVQVGYINTLKMRRKAYLLDYFLKEEERNLSVLVFFFFQFHQRNKS